MGKRALSSKESITAFHLSETVYEKSVAAKVKRFPRWFSKAVASVTFDLRISFEAKTVYSALGLQTKGNTCCVGMRYLGRLLDLSPASIKRRIDELVAAGHLERIESGNGQRGSYRFTSPAYQNTGKCRRCGRQCKDRDDSGYCWLCVELAS